MDQLADLSLLCMEGRYCSEMGLAKEANQFVSSRQPAVNECLSSGNLNGKI